MGGLFLFNWRRLFFSLISFVSSNYLSLVKKFLYIIVAVFTFLSCSSDKTDVLSQGMMEDIIYDIHIAQSMTDMGDYDQRELESVKMRLAVLKKYDVTQAEWDSSFNYYCRHAEQLHDIYDNVAERMRDEVISLGGDVAFETEGFSKDTANIWNLERHFILIPNEPYNVKTFEIQADSTLKKGDKLTLQFDTQFLFQDGMRDYVVVLALTFQNDSVACQTRHVSQQGRTSFSVQDDDRLGIKKVAGYFIMNRSLSDVPSTTLRLASIYNVKIIVAHVEEKKQEKPVEQQPNDSANAVKKDSVAAPSQEGGPAQPL